MLIFDTPWITHEGGSIFSLDIHPTGNKLATAGQDSGGGGLLIIWDIEFVSVVTADSSENCSCSNQLARVPHSSKCINCVRWSKHSDGRRLVCAGDDAVICIYDCVGVYSSMGSISQPNEKTKRNIESYRCTHKLYGHSIDVTHIDWSPDGKCLASCSLDNTVIIWNAIKLPEKIVILKDSDGGHVRGVKGLAWDPVGRFLATQSEDNTLKIWQTDTWNCVRTLSEPFQESANSTLFCRMDWSFDGSYLVAPCSMNNGGPTAKIFVRKDWSYARDLVGFRKAVSCVRTNPACFQRDNAAGIHNTVSCFAVGSRDRSLSVWLIPNFGRPLLVLFKLFKLSVIDLSWNGLTLGACSMDGAVKLIKFSEGEIGHMLSSQDTGLIMERIYGFRPQGESRKFSEEISAEFGYSSICEALSKRAAETTISANEIHKIAYNRELSTRKAMRTQMLQRFVQKSKKLMKNFNAVTEAKINSANNEQKQQNNTDGIQPKIDGLFYERKRKDEENDGLALFEFPDPKQLFLVDIQPDNGDSLLMYAEMVNNYFCTGTELSASHLSVYRNNADCGGKYERCWEFFTNHFISLLVANRHWTIFSSFDGHLFVLSTSTGRLLFEHCEEPLAVLELEQNLCLTIGISGVFSLYNVMDGRTLARHSLIDLLYENPDRQLLASSFSSTVQNENEANIVSMFSGLLFSDLNSFDYSAKLNGWNKNHTFMDLVSDDQLPANISSMLLQSAHTSQPL